MKAFVFFGLCILAGCATRPTMQQLESEALVTGDWSAVQQRENAIKRRQQRQGPECPPRSISYCVQSFGETRCACVARESIYSAFSPF